MEREIKFRGKANIPQTELNEKGIPHEDGWVIGYLNKLRNRCYILSELIEADDDYIIAEYWVPVINETVGQFTGKKDKNGTFIYDGDKIRHGESVRFIEFRAPNYIAIRENKKDAILLSFCTHPEVIGNIHESSKI